MRYIALSALLLALGVAAQAQWSDGGWSYSIDRSSAGGYTVNASSPGVSAVAPSGGSYHNYVDVLYSDTLSANGQSYNVTIKWTYYLYGHVNQSTSCASYCSWPPSGAESDGLTGGGTYDVGPTLETGHDTTVSPPGSTVTVEVNADAQASSFYPSSSSTATATLNGAYTP